MSERAKQRKGQILEFPRKPNTLTDGALALAQKPRMLLRGLANILKPVQLIENTLKANGNTDDEINLSTKSHQSNLISFKEATNSRLVTEANDIRPVTKHEVAHARVARGLGWRVISLTARKTWGVTLAVAAGFKSTKNLLLDSIAISSAGEVATGPAGAGYDRGKQRFLARIVRYFFEPYSSENEIISRQRGVASRILMADSIGFERETDQTAFEQAKAA